MPPSNPNFPPNLSISPSKNTQPTSTLSSTFTFNFRAQETAIAKYGIAGRVWEAAYIMLLYLSIPPAHAFDPPFDTARRPLTVVELGSGTGVVGLELAERLVAEGRTGDKIALTDLPEVCALLEENKRVRMRTARARAMVEVEVMPLAWGDAGHASEVARRLGLGRERGEAEDTRYLTHVVCSDLVYFPELLAPLLRTLLHLTSLAPPQPPEIIIAYKIRSLAKETPFWSAFGLWFVFAPVLASSASAPGWTRLGVEADAFVFVARRRPESMAWDVPEDDGALLGGVGARGNEARKNDDTFELLLLMGLDEEADAAIP